MYYVLENGDWRGGCGSVRMGSGGSAAGVVAGTKTNVWEGREAGINARMDWFGLVGVDRSIASG
jgi:hypothetical protein